MHCSNLPSDSSSSTERAFGDQGIHKSAITKARREQNRRAQRAFRERQRAKNRFPRSTKLRLLAPFPHEVRAHVTRGSSDTETLDQDQSVASFEGLSPSVLSQRFVGGAQHRQDASLCGNKDVRFTFSSPQNLLPTHQSLVPKNRTPFSELLDLMRDRPKVALLPRGVTTTLAACLFNARALGIDIERVMDPQYTSPFYQASFSPIPIRGSPEYRTEQNITMNQQMAIPSSLRPCSAQLTFRHHVCIDMLPLPKLREMAVMLTFHAQRVRVDGGARVIDRVQELKKDVYIRQGVRFRGTGELIAGEYVTNDECEQHCGHPWERGSWAVALWFARKWTYM